MHGIYFEVGNGKESTRHAVLRHSTQFETPMLRPEGLRRLWHSIRLLLRLFSKKSGGSVGLSNYLPGAVM